MTDMTWAVLTSSKDTAGSIKRWVNNSSIDPEEIIAEAEHWMNKRMRVRRMQSRATITLPADTSSIVLTAATPTAISDFLDPIRLYLRGYYPLEYRYDDELDRFQELEDDGTFSFEDAPTMFWLLGNTLYFDTRSDQEYTLLLTYYAKPTPLASVGSTTNLYTTDFRDTFKKVLMAHAYLFLKDEERAVGILAAAMQDIQQLNSMDDLARRGQVYEHEVYW